MVKYRSLFLPLKELFYIYIYIYIIYINKSKLEFIISKFQLSNSNYWEKNLIK